MEDSCPPEFLPVGADNDSTMRQLNKSTNKVKKVIYLDHAATTPTRPEVIKAMAPFWSDKFGNPSALYKLGLEAKSATDTARSNVASVLFCRPEEVVFTAGGSESINLAILGSARNYRKNYKTGGHIITSTIEHHAVLHTIGVLKKEGFTVTKISVDTMGVFNVAEVRKAIRPDTFLVSLMYANNEIGTIEPIAEIAKLIATVNTSRLPTSPRLRRAGKSHSSRLLFHTDACQAAGFLDLNVNKLHVDMLSLNGSKIYGPKQTGCLYVRKGTKLEPLIYGGGQEKDLRSGTENVPGIVGFAKALVLAQQSREKESKKQALLRDYFITRLQKAIPSLKLNGPMPTTTKHNSNIRRLPNNINISFAGVDGEALVLYLDANNICASTGSACTSSSTDPSHVLEAIGLELKFIKGSIRFTLGNSTTKADLDKVLKILPKLLTQVRAMRNS